VLHGIDLAIRRRAGGDHGALRSGKSTLLNILGAWTSDLGDLLLGGVDVSHLPDDERSRCATGPSASCSRPSTCSRPDHRRERRAAHGVRRRAAAEQRRRRWSSWSWWAWATAWNHRPSELSGGERQRVASPGRWRTGRRCCSPTSPPARWTPGAAAHLELLLKIHATLGTTQIIVTHDPRSPRTWGTAPSASRTEDRGLSRARAPAPRLPPARRALGVRPARRARRARRVRGSASPPSRPAPRPGGRGRREEVEERDKDLFTGFLVPANAPTCTPRRPASGCAAGTPTGGPSS
jgi:ABC-type ATPase involved in cell division